MTIRLYVSRTWRVALALAVSVPVSATGVLVATLSAMGQLERSDACNEYTAALTLALLVLVAAVGFAALHRGAAGSIAWTASEVRFGRVVMRPASVDPVRVTQGRAFRWITVTGDDGESVRIPIAVVVGRRTYALFQAEDERAAASALIRSESANVAILSAILPRV